MRYSNGYIRLLSVDPRYRYVYTLAVAMISVFAWTLFWYMPMEKRLLKTTQEIKQLRQDGQQCVEQEVSCGKLAVEVEQLMHDVQNICDSSSASQSISLLIQYIQDAGMQLISLRTTEQKEHAWYTAAHETFEAVGSISAVIQFFALLAKYQMLVQCDDFSLQRQADDTFLLHCVLRQMLPKSKPFAEIKSPSTLRKS